MNPTIDNMLSLTAEIAEELLMIKDAGATRVPDSLKLKILSLAELAASSDDAQPAQETPTAVPEPEPETPIAPEPEAEAEVEEEVSEAEEAESAETTIAPAPEAEAEVEEEEREAEAEEANEAEAAESTAEHPNTSEVFDTVENAEVEEVAASAEFEEIADSYEPEFVVKSGISEMPETAEVPETQAETTAQPVYVINPDLLRRTFSINDAFLFRREIFEGSRDAFHNALNYIATLSTVRQLQCYLVENLGLNLNESPGKDFYEILLPFFHD